MLTSSITGVAQIFDSNLVTTQTELNFNHTDKRGIQSEKGQIYWVNEDLQTLKAFDQHHHLLWEVNVIEACNVETTHTPNIRYMKLNEKDLSITFAKHSFASVNRKTGQVEYIGSD